jgi:pimeloyl-ACP methyl ester carboxylesterase
MDPGADISLPGVALLVTELLDRLDLHDVTLFGADTGGALVHLVIAGDAARVAGVVLASCDAFENFPPGATGRTLGRTGRLAPRLFGLFMQQTRFRLVRRLPFAFGWLTKRGDAVARAWMKPVLTQQEIRRGTVRVLRSIAAAPDLLINTAGAVTELRSAGPRRMG